MSRKTLLFYAIASSLLGFAARSKNTTQDKIIPARNSFIEKSISANVSYKYKTPVKATFLNQYTLQ